MNANIFLFFFQFSRTIEDYFAKSLRGPFILKVRVKQSKFIFHFLKLC